MKKTLLLMGLLFLIVGCNSEKSEKMPTRFQSVDVSQAEILQDGKEKSACHVCGMNLPMFYKTNHSATVDGKIEQFCSIHCLANTLKQGKKVEDIKVVNNEDLKFISAKDAWYVVGSSKSGTMSKISKYAFAHKEKAEAFAKDFGGKVMNFDSALAEAKKELK
jgi:nitrous oxide reductase accessory protein NosL